MDCSQASETSVTRQGEDALVDIRRAQYRRRREGCFHRVKSFLTLGRPVELHTFPEESVQGVDLGCHVGGTGRAFCLIGGWSPVSMRNFNQGHLPNV